MLYRAYVVKEIRDAKFHLRMAIKERLAGGGVYIGHLIWVRFHLRAAEAHLRNAERYMLATMLDRYKKRL